jgi:hypothetical protein
MARESLPRAFSKPQSSSWSGGRSAGRRAPPRPERPGSATVVPSIEGRQPRDVRYWRQARAARDDSPRPGSSLACPLHTTENRGLRPAFPSGRSHSHGVSPHARSPGRKSTAVGGYPARRVPDRSPRRAGTASVPGMRLEPTGRSPGCGVLPSGTRSQLPPSRARAGGPSGRAGPGEPPSSLQLPARTQRMLLHSEAPPGRLARRLPFPPPLGATARSSGSLKKPGRSVLSPRPDACAQSRA